MVGQEVRSGKGRGLPQEMVMCGRRGRDRRGRVREGEGEERGVGGAYGWRGGVHSAGKERSPIPKANGIRRKRNKTN